MTGLKAVIIHVTPFEQNCTFLWNEESGKGAIVDPGGDIELIKSAIEKAGFEVEKIVLTHGHIDHAGGAAELKEALGVVIEGPHEADRQLLDNLEEQGKLYGIDGVRNVEPDLWLKDGDQIEMAGQVFDVYHCPGHSPGSVVFVDAVARFALVGDVLFKDSIGRTDFPYGDHDALISAIKEKLLPLGDDIEFICGHGPGSTFGEERQANPFLQ